MKQTLEMKDANEFEITPEIKKKLLGKYAPRIFKIKSSDGKKEYLITLARNHLNCNCPDATYRNLNPDGTRKKVHHYCKHERQLAIELLRGK